MFKGVDSTLLFALLKLDLSQDLHNQMLNVCMENPGITKVTRAIEEKTRSRGGGNTVKIIIEKGLFKSGDLLVLDPSFLNGEDRATVNRWLEADQSRTRLKWTPREDSKVRDYIWWGFGEGRHTCNEVWKLILKENDLTEHYPRDRQYTVWVKRGEKSLAEWADEYR